MYVAAVNEVRALDARTGKQMWQFVRPQTPGLVPTGDPAAGINRAIAVLGDRVFLQTDHAHLLALDRRTGRLLWDVEMADYRQNYGATGALLVVNDLVIAGISAGDEGVRGFLDAYRASTGERVWRFWTVPARGEPGSETWIGKALEHGCATTWLTGSYDPEANLLYWPTGNPCPDYNGDERKGDNLYSSSVVALDPATRKAAMAFSVHAARSSRLGCEPAAAARRRPFSADAPRKSARRRESQWFLLRARSAHRPDADGRTLREEHHVGLRHRRRRPAEAACRRMRTPSTARRRALRFLAQPTGHHRHSIPTTGLFYVMASEALFGVPEEFGLVRARQVVLWRDDEAARRSKAAENFCERSTCKSGKLVWEVPEGRRQRHAHRAPEHRRRPRVLRRQHRWSLGCRRREDRTASLEVRHAGDMEVESDDVCGSTESSTSAWSQGRP